MKRWLLALLFLFLGWRPALAQTTEYESCTDASGHTVTAQQDAALKTVVQSGVENGQAVIRYNPDVLPRLSPKGRMFLFAQECARFALHAVPNVMPTPARAHQADCLGVAMLTESGLLADADAVQQLQSELSFSQDEWALVPGPQRSFDFSTCNKQHATTIKLPSPGLPSAKQTDWNACTRVCADRLRSCQTGCGGEACVGRCVTTYDKCEAACGG